MGDNVGHEQCLGYHKWFGTGGGGVGVTLFYENRLSTIALLVSFFNTALPVSSQQAPHQWEGQTTTLFVRQ